MLQDKVGAWAAGEHSRRLGMLDDINVDSLIMESIRNDEPASADERRAGRTLIDERQRTLAERYRAGV